MSIFFVEGLQLRQHTYYHTAGNFTIWWNTRRKGVPYHFIIHLNIGKSWSQYICYDFIATSNDLEATSSDTILPKTGQPTYITGKGCSKWISTLTFTFNSFIPLLTNLSGLGRLVSTEEAKKIPGGQLHLKFMPIARLTRQKMNFVSPLCLESRLFLLF